MMRRTFVTALVVLASLVALSCKEGGGDATADGGKQPKLICKMNNQCWICPSEDAMKKCILNPVTSGCKQGSASDCP
jgi:hypothetical protein